jgi:branched-chain amino acid aminotransferase
MANNEIKYTWMDGKLVEFEKATIPFMNSTLHYGSGVFEGIRCYDTERGPAVFRLREHMERLVDSAFVLGFRSLPFTASELVEATKKIVAANGFKECYIRPLVFHDSPFPALNLDAGGARIGIGVWPMGTYLGEEALEKGVRANIASFTRHHPNVMMTKTKICGNYANSTLAKTESIRLGFDEAIMLDPQGFVAECTGENLFLVRKGKIFTPPTATILEGITRDALITLATDLGYVVIEMPISRDQLYIADEVFVCGTAAECTGVCEIDFRKIGEGKTGPVTRALQKVFFDTVHGKGSHSAEWLVYVN